MRFSYTKLSRKLVLMVMVMALALQAPLATLLDLAVGARDTSASGEYSEKSGDDETQFGDRSSKTRDVDSAKDSAATRGADPSEEGGWKWSDSGNANNNYIAKVEVRKAKAQAPLNKDAFHDLVNPVAKDAVVYLNYYFEFPETEFDITDPNAKSVIVELPIPKQLGSAKMDIDDISFEGEPIAQDIKIADSVVYNNTNNLSLFVTYVPNSKSDVWGRIEFSAQFVPEEVGNSGPTNIPFVLGLTQQNIEIVFAKVAETAKIDVVKTLASDVNNPAGGEYVWNVKITPTTTPTQRLAIPGVIITDEIQKPQEYVPNSFKLVDEKGNDAGGTLAFAEPSGNTLGKLTYTTDLVGGKAYTATYRTTLTDDVGEIIASAVGDTIPIKNTVVVNYPTQLAPATGGVLDPKPIDKSSSVDKAKDFILIGKHGTIIGDFERGKDSYVTWSFTFNESKINFGSFPVSITDVLDFIGTNKAAENDPETKFAYLGAPTGVKFKEGKITVDETTYASSMNNMDDADNGSVYYETSTEDVEGVNCPKLTVNGLEKLLTNTYTIAFQTKVDDQYFYHTNKEIPNKATLHVDTTPNNPNDDPKDFTVGVGVGTSDPGDVANSMLEKSSDSYNRATRRIKWTVTLNAAKAEIWNGSFADTIPSTGKEAQKFITASPAPTVTKNGTPIDPWADWLTYNDDDNTLSHNFKNDSPPPSDTAPSTDTYVITYETEALSPEIWGVNSDGKVHNSAVFGFNYKPANGNAQWKEESVIPDQSTQSTVISKKWSDYDYQNQEATWKITFNQNAMPIDNCVITDTIPAGQSYVGFELTSPLSGITPDDVKVTINPKSSDGSAEQIVKFSFDGQGSSKRVNSQGELTIKTKLHSVLNQGSEITNNQVVLKNSAHIAGSVDGVTFDGPVVEGESPNLAGDVVNKVGKGDIESCSITWTVNMNELGVDFNGAGEIKDMIDTIPAGLTLVGSTVKLYNATVGTDGKATEGTEVSPHGITLWNVDGNGNETTQIIGGAMEATGEVKFKFNDTLKKPYVLKFVTTVDKPGKKDYKNSVSISGTVSTISGTSGGVNDMFPDSGSVGFGKNGSLKVIKTDAINSEKKLAGAEFKLRNKNYGYDIKGGVTNANGEIVNEDGSPYYNNLYLGIEYQLIETKSPPHYQLKDPINGDIVKEFKLGKKGDLPDDATITITNTQSTDPADLGKLTVVKSDADDTAHTLAGATFTLQKNFGDNGYITPTTAATGSDGRLTFENLAFGKYTLTETVAPDGYLLDGAGKTVTVSGDEGEFIQTINVTNKPDTSKTTASVKKTDAQTGKSLAGATFTLTDASGTSVPSTPPGDVTDANGELTFSGLSYGKYTLTETVAPAGYQLDNKPREFTLSSGNRTHSVPFQNSPNPATVIVTKVDASDNRLLEYVQFTLTDVTDRTDKETMKTYITDEDGKITISDLRWGDYELVESKPLAEYKPDATVHKIHVDAKTTSPINITIENTPKPGDATVRKLDATTQDPLAGAVFECRDATGRPVASSPQTTGADGIARFSGLAYGKYTLKEISPPPAFELNSSEISFTISSNPDGKIHKHFSTDFSDTQIPGSITLTKLAAGQPDKKLEGAIFQLRDATGAPIGAPQTTGADGVAKFTALPHGAYVISEVQAPSGYQLSKTTWSFKIPDESGKVDFAADIENTLSPPSSGGGNSEPSNPKLPPKDPPKDPDGSSTPDAPATPPTEPPVVTSPDTPVNGNVEVPPDGNVTVTTPPTHGTVTVNPDTGDWTYTPDPDYRGDDSFTVTISDKDGKKVPKTVLVTIEEPDVPLAKGNIPITGDSSPLASCVAAASALTAMLLLRRKRSHR